MKDRAQQTKWMRIMRVFFIEPKLLFISFLAAWVVLATTLWVPLVIRQAFDEAIPQKELGTLLRFTAFIVGLSALNAGGVYVRKLLTGRAGVATEAKLRARLNDHLHALDMTYYERMPIGQLMSRASSDLQLIGHALGSLPYFSAQVLFMLISTGILVGIDIQLSIVLLIGVPLVGASAVVLSRKLEPLVGRTQQHLGEMTSLVEETITGIRVVKAFGRERFQGDRVAGAATDAMNTAMASIRVRATLISLFELFPAALLAAIVWYGGQRVLARALTIGDFVLFAAYATRMVQPVRSMGWFSSEIRQASAAVQRIYDVLDTRPGIADHPSAKPIEISKGAVRFEDVSYRVDDTTIVDGFTLDVPAGSSLALVGPTGCGKTTLLRLILRFLEPTSGGILIDGHDISNATLHSLRENIGTVFEDTFLFSDTIGANIAFGNVEASEEEIVEAAYLAQAIEFIEELPDGFDTVVGEQGYTLSGGQRQRIAIARAIIMRPKLLLLDDATSSVDPRVEELIRAGLQEAMKGRTTLIVARRPASAALADHVVLMDAGRIIAEGSHEDLWERLPEYRRALAGADAEVGVTR